MPGHGEELPTCGSLVHRGHSWRACCEVHYRAAHADCRRFECPVCHGWAFREADHITRRVESGAALGGWKPAHFVVSPPTATAEVSISSPDGYRRLRTEAYRVAKDRGIRGGAVVFHHMRMASERWGGNGCPRSGPHFHVVGDGWLDHRAVATGELRDGWVVRGFGVRKSVRDTALYLLSHASQAEPRPSGNPALEQPTVRRSPFEVVTWFGSLSYNRLRLGRTPSEGVFCAICLELVPLREWFDLSWCGEGPPPEEPGVARSGEWRASATDRTDGTPRRYIREV